ncbi:unnamed protein product [Cutaneotrichosporon oleaginosum]
MAITYYDDEKASSKEVLPHDGDILQGDKDKHNYVVEVAPVGEHVTVHDAVFGEVGEEGPNYRSVSWMGAAALMTKANVGLGVLSIPEVFKQVGLIPGLILILVIQGIATYADYVICTFKLNHLEVFGLADAGMVMFGRAGKEFLAITFCLYMIFVSGSAMIALSTALNAISMHGACTAIFVAVAAITGFIFSSIRTLGQIMWLGWVGCVSIVAALLILVIAVGTQGAPVDLPPGESVVIKLFGTPTFARAMSSIASLVFACGGAPTFFGMISEMRDPREYPKALFASQGFVTVLFCVIGAVTYAFCGDYVASPALGSAGPLLKKVCYGIAIPALLLTLMIYCHTAAKYIMVRLLRGTRHLTANTATHWTVWLSSVFGCIFIAYILASSIPVFGSLISFVGALFSPIMAMGPYSLMWLYDNYRDPMADGRFWKARAGRTLRNKLLTGYHFLICLVTIFLTVGGTYGSIVDLIDASKSAQNKPWTCADNSNSVKQ